VSYGSSAAILAWTFWSVRKVAVRTNWLQIVSFTYINVSQGSVATQFRWCEIINNPFIAIIPQSVPVKEFLKSVNIWRRCGRKYGDMFFWLTVYNRALKTFWVQLWHYPSGQLSRNACWTAWASPQFWQWVETIVITRHWIEEQMSSSLAPLAKKIISPLYLISVVGPQRCKYQKLVYILNFENIIAVPL